LFIINFENIIIYNRFINGIKLSRLIISNIKSIYNFIKKINYDNQKLVKNFWKIMIKIEIKFEIKEFLNSFEDDKIFNSHFEIS